MKKITFALLSLIAAHSELASSLTLDIWYDNNEIYVGETRRLNWKSSGAVECHNSKGLNLPLNGSWTSNPNTVAGSWLTEFTCTDDNGGSVSDSELYTVLPNVIAQFEPSSGVKKGDIIALRWEIARNNSCVVYFAGGKTSFDSSNPDGYQVYEINSAGLQSATITCENTITNSYSSTSVELEVGSINGLDLSFLGMFEANMSPVNGTDNDWISGIGYSSWEMYERWPTIDGLLDSYLTTGDRSYLEYALAAGEEFIANEKPEGWYSENSESYGHGMAEWRAGAAIGRTISIILNDDKVLYKLTPIISLRAEKLREKLVTRIWDKWKGVGGLNTNVTHFIGRIGVMGLGLKNTHKLVNPGTPNPYTGELTRLANDLNNSLLANINGESQNILCRISNPQNCGVDYNYTIDVSHAGDTVNFIVEAYLAGVVFDKETIWRLINTVKTVIKHQTELKFNDLVNGQGGFGVRGMQQGGWIKLARFDPELRQLYKDWAINPNNLPPSKYTVLHILGNLGRAINKK